MAGMELGYPDGAIYLYINGYLPIHMLHRAWYYSPWVFVIHSKCMDKDQSGVYGATAEQSKFICGRCRY